MSLLCRWVLCDCDQSISLLMCAYLLIFMLMLLVTCVWRLWNKVYILTYSLKSRLAIRCCSRSVATCRKLLSITRTMWLVSPMGSASEGQRKRKTLTHWHIKSWDRKMENGKWLAFAKFNSNYGTSTARRLEAVSYSFGALAIALHLDDSDGSDANWSEWRQTNFGDIGSYTLTTSPTIAPENCRRSADRRLLRRVHDRSTFRHRFSSMWTRHVLWLVCWHLNWHGKQMTCLPIEIDTVLRLYTTENFTVLWALRSPPTTLVLVVDRLSNQQRLWQRCREL